MFKYELSEDNVSLESLYQRIDTLSTEGMISDAVHYVWEKIKAFCTKVADTLSSLWNKLFARKQQVVEKYTTLRDQVSKMPADKLRERLKQPIREKSTEAFNPDGRGCFIVPKDEMIRVLADIEKATNYINTFGDKFIAKIRQINPSGKLVSATEADLPAIEAELDELMNEQKVREKIAADFHSMCPTLQMNLNNTFVVTQDTIQVLWKTPPNKGDGTYAELGYKTEADIKQICDVFIDSVKKGYNNRDKKYIDELYAIKDEVQKQERDHNTSDEISKKKAKIYNRIIDWLMMLKKMTIILDKEQMSLIENCYGSLSQLTATAPTTWNWRSF